MRAVVILYTLLSGETFLGPTTYDVCLAVTERLNRGELVEIPHPDNEALIVQIVQAACLEQE